MKFRFIYLCLFLFAFGNNVVAQSLNRSIALLDLSIRNAEANDGQIFSAKHILNITGIPFSVTADLNVAMENALILCSADIESNTFSTDEKNSLKTYVENGGVLIASRVTDEELFPLFGISTAINSTTNHLVKWNNSLSTSLFRWIDEPEEWTISLGRESYENIFKTYSYNLSTAIALANYENGTVAVTQNQYNVGFSYVFGFAWKEIILRNQINRDYEAQRIGSNGFEPSMDVVMLLMRAIFNEHIPYSTWKHTSSNNSTSTLMITHDVDSTTGVDSLLVFADSEMNMGIIATYNMTVRYFSDVLMSDFYNGSLPNLNHVISKGHVIGSHSVGHFFDFSDDAIFPIGSPGNTMSTYTPYNNGIITTGGTVYGECEVSKDVLEAELDVNIRTFRSGHLAYNKFLVDVLDDLGYLYNSSYTANDVLTNFPYQNKKGRSFSGQISNVYELPVSISDVYQSDPLTGENYIQKADIWLDVIAKVDANNAPTVLLIHPNRGYKLIGQEYFISHLPASICIKEMGAYGDYWRAREAFDFKTQSFGNSLQISILGQDLAINEDISLIVNNGRDLGDLTVMWEDEFSVDFTAENWGDNDLILYDFKISVGIDDLTRSDPNKELIATIFPNPIEDDLNIELELKMASDIEVMLFDIYGRLILQRFHAKQTSGHQILNLNLNELHLKRGIYFCKINAGANGDIVQKVIIK